MIRLERASAGQVLGGERRRGRQLKVLGNGSMPPEAEGAGIPSDGIGAGGQAAGFAVGEVAISTAGRDRGHAYVVVRVDTSPFVMVADGLKRRVGRPKRKNVRHLTRPPVTAFPDFEPAIGWPEGRARGRPGGQLSDEEVRAILRRAAAVLGEGGIQDGEKAANSRGSREGDV